MDHDERTENDAASDKPPADSPAEEGLVDPRDLVDSGSPNPPIVQPQEQATDEPLPQPGSPAQDGESEAGSSG